MTNIFLISDTHFGQETINHFKTYSGEKLRPFTCAEEADQKMLDNWNSVVKPNDRVYHLGDVAYRRRHLAILNKLNGTKVLIRGNHDTEQAKTYLKYFKDVRGVHFLDNFILSHYPIHAESKARYKGNIHGHVHSNSLSDPFYYNVSVEVINYTPVPFEYIRSMGIV